MQLCSKCHIEKPESEFHFNKSKNRLSAHCVVCHKQYMKSHYDRRKQYYVDKALVRNKKVQDENRKKLWDYLLVHPCVDCGEVEPIFLEFDHVRGEKYMEVSRMINGWRWETILAEIAKCDVRCVKCHRLKTYKEVGWYGWDFMSLDSGL